jgi:DNA-binding transcriptional LysR family regulator
VRLFDRGSQGAELAAHGELLLRCGINVFDEMQQGLRSLEHLSDPNFGEVRLGCTDIILHSLVPPIVRKFSARYPGVQLDIRLTNPGEHQIQELREIDLLMTRATGQQDDFHSEVLFDEPLSSLWERTVNWRESVELSSLTSSRAIRSSLPLTARQAHWLPRYFEPTAFSPPKPLVKTIAIQLTVSLIASGEFVGILPMSVAALSAHQAALRVLPLKSPGPRLSAEIVFLRNRTLSPAVQSFINCAREVAKSQVRVP